MKSLSKLTTRTFIFFLNSIYFVLEAWVNSFALSRGLLFLKVQSLRNDTDFLDFLKKNKMLRHQQKVW